MRYALSDSDIEPFKNGQYLRKNNIDNVYDIYIKTSFAAPLTGGGNGRSVPDTDWAHDDYVRLVEVCRTHEALPNE